MACSGSEKQRITFIKSAIAEHQSSDIYRTAIDAQLYYEGENPTINRYEKILYDMQGRAHRDMYSANHKIASSFFGFVVDQENSYLLGNGVSFQGKDTKKKLGRDFDQKISRASEYALIGGVSFGFWDLDHVEVFQITEFIPLYDEENGALMAGIRFWRIASGKPLRCTLYESDGFTEYIQDKDKDMEAMRPKRQYKIHITTSAALGGNKIYEGENYPTFPIVPLKNNRWCKSELCGKRNTIDALDLACSNMVNNVDEGNIIYWALVNCGGMDYEDAAKFLQQVRMTKVAFMENGDTGARAEPHTIEAPYAGTQTAIDMLQKKLYQDFQAFDAAAVQAGNQTATAIKASYVPLDLKTDKFERQVTEFISGILTLAGIEDEPTYTRNKIINTQEEMQTLLLAAPYADDEYITTKALTILGDGDMAEEILKRKAAEDLGRFNDSDSQNEANPSEIVSGTEAVQAAEQAAGKTLNGSQTQSLIQVISQLQSGMITEGQAVNIIATAIGVSKDDARAIIRGDA